MKRMLFVAALLVLAVGCSDSGSTTDGQNTADAGSDAQQSSTVKLSYDFAEGAQQWAADVTDYPKGAREQLNFVGEVQPLPSELDDSKTAFYLKADNTTSSIFMFLKRQLGPDDGLKPDTDYTIAYKVTFATNYPDDCTEQAGQLMIWKMGGSTWEPGNTLSDDQSTYQLNVRKGDAIKVGGPAASTAGDVTHDQPCAQVVDKYVEVTREHTHNANVTTSPDGNLWLLLGVDSTYLGENSLYVEKNRRHAHAGRPVAPSTSKDARRRRADRRPRLPNSTHFCAPHRRYAHLAHRGAGCRLSPRFSWRSLRSVGQAHKGRSRRRATSFCRATRALHNLKGPARRRCTSFGARTSTRHKSRTRDTRDGKDSVGGPVYAHRDLLGVCLVPLMAQQRVDTKVDQLGVLELTLAMGTLERTPQAFGDGAARLIARLAADRDPAQIQRVECVVDECHTALCDQAASLEGLANPIVHLGTATLGIDAHESRCSYQVAAHSDGAGQCDTLFDRAQHVADPFACLFEGRGDRFTALPLLEVAAIDIHALEQRLGVRRRKRLQRHAAAEAL